jgi:hypothetical protein
MLDQWEREGVAFKAGAGNMLRNVPRNTKYSSTSCGRQNLLKPNLFGDSWNNPRKSFVILQYNRYLLKIDQPIKYYRMLKKLLSLVLGGKQPKPAYAYVPKPQNNLPKKTRN